MKQQQIQPSTPAKRPRVKSQDRSNLRSRARRLDAWLSRIQSEGLATVRQVGDVLLQSCKREGCTEEFEPKPGKLFCNTPPCRRARGASHSSEYYSLHKAARLKYAREHRDRDNATRRARYRRNPRKVLRLNKQRRAKYFPKIQEANRKRYVREREKLAEAERLKNVEGLDLKTGLRVSLLAHRFVEGAKPYDMKDGDVIYPGSQDPSSALRQLQSRFSAIIQIEQTRIRALPLEQRQSEKLNLIQRLRAEEAKPKKTVR
jgi:hypothetical protein